jgi:succinylarginine dihydrolase
MGFDPADSTTRFPARQTREAYEAIVRRHGTKHALFVRQHPRAIDAGAFHNDVVCVGHRDILLIHALAWQDQGRVLDELRANFERIAQRPLRVIEVSDDEIPLSDAVKSYLFNSQIVTTTEGRVVLIAPIESHENPRVADAIARIVESGVGIDAVQFVDVRQSMRNGGGPACLRLRVELTDDEMASMHPGVVFTPELDAHLVAWVERHYRSELRPQDLRDPALLRESRDALQALADILKLDPNTILGPT